MVLDGMVVDTPLIRTESMVMDILVKRPGLGWSGYGYTIKQNYMYGHRYNSKQIWSWICSWIYQ